LASAALPAATFLLTDYKGKHAQRLREKAQFLQPLPGKTAAAAVRAPLKYAESHLIR
jgi:hypothetical protein